MNLKIQNYLPEDFSEIERIYNVCKMDELKFEVSEFTLIPLLDDTKRKAELFESDIYVYRDEHIKGYVAINGSNISGLNVLPEFRGQGIAKALLKTALTKTTPPVSLQVVSSNSPALALYQSFGFCLERTFDVTYNAKPVRVSGLKLDLDQ